MGTKLAGTGAGTRNGAMFTFVASVPTGAGALTTKTGGTASLTAGQYVVAAVGVGVATAPSAYPTQTSAGTALTRLIDFPSANTRMVVFGFTATAADVAGADTLTLTSATGAAFVSLCRAYNNVSGAEVIASSGANAPQTGTGSPPVYPGQAAPAQSGDQQVWLLLQRQAAGSYGFGTAAGTPNSMYSGASPAVEGIAGIQNNGTTTAGLALSCADKTSDLGTGAQSALTGVVIPTARTDAATVTSGSATVADTSILASDQGRSVTGTGIPASSFVGTVTAGSSFLLSSSATAQTAVTATAAGSSVVVGSALTWITAGLALIPISVPTATVGGAQAGACQATLTGSATGTPPGGRTIASCAVTVSATTGGGGTLGPNPNTLTGTSVAPTVKGGSRTGTVTLQYVFTDSAGSTTAPLTQTFTFTAAATTNSAPSPTTQTVDPSQSITTTGTVTDPQGQTPTITVTPDSGSPTGTLTVGTTTVSSGVSTTTWSYTATSATAGSYGWTQDSTNQDAAGSNASKHFTATVAAAPVAVISAASTTVDVRTAMAHIALNGTGSAGSGNTYAWTLTSAPAGWSLSSTNIGKPNLNILKGKGGTGTLGLTVTDGQGLSSAAVTQAIQAQVNCDLIVFPEGLVLVANTVPLIPYAPATNPPAVTSTSTTTSVPAGSAL